jgi:transcriptional regulator with XRE-family HTH domain
MTKDKTKVIDRIRARTKPENVRFVQKNLKISHQIAVLLKEKGWSQKDLAKKIGKQESEVSKLLSGRHNITLHTLTKIETVLGEDIIITPIEAFEKYKSTDYVTFYVQVHNDMVADMQENIKYKGKHHQEIFAA